MSEGVPFPQTNSSQGQHVLTGVVRTSAPEIQRHAHPLSGLVAEEYVAVFPSEKIDPAGDVHILAAIGGDLLHAALLPPAQGLQAVGALALVKGGLRHIVQ